jgi:hypothetical protein
VFLISNIYCLIIEQDRFIMINQPSYRRFFDSLSLFINVTFLAPRWIKDPQNRHHQHTHIRTRNPIRSLNTQTHKVLHNIWIINSILTPFVCHHERKRQLSSKIPSTSRSSNSKRYFCNIKRQIMHYAVSFTSLPVDSLYLGGLVLVLEIKDCHCRRLCYSLHSMAFPVHLVCRSKIWYDRKMQRAIRLIVINHNIMGCRDNTMHTNTKVGMK